MINPIPGRREAAHRESTANKANGNSSDDYSRPTTIVVRRSWRVSAREQGAHFDILANYVLN